jgi:multicomponent K+:H+ antiporter subunit E
MNAVLSSPRTILGVVVLWCLMNGLSAGQVVLGTIVGALVAWASAPYWPDRPKIRNPLKLTAYVAIVAWDILVSSLQVARLILSGRRSGLRSQFVVVPLEITRPEAIAVLAGSITLTPGTLSADLSADGRALLVHCLDTGDPAGTVGTIKARYEARLKEIFP